MTTSGLPRNLEKHIRRRLSSPPPKTRPVTLQDLIQQLRQIADKIAEPKVRRRTLKGKAMSVKQATETIAGLADAITRAKGVAASAQSTVNGAFLNDYTWTGTISRLKSLLQQIK